jgi:glycosyltransferase involved in cell wall biosynthesis
MLRLGEHAAKRFADRVLVVSSDLEEHFLETHGVHALAVPNGADLPPVPAPDQALSPLDLESGRFHLYLGRLVPEKNLHLLIEAHAEAHASWPLVIVGGHTHAEAYYAQLRAMAHDGVRFLGPRYGEEKATLLGHAGSFCLPSEIEGFPVALLEAMAAARPCIVSDLPPHREIFESSQQGGEILPLGEVSAWADALRRLEAADGEALRTRGQQARDRVEAAYSWDANASATLAVYRDVLGIAPAEALG